MFDTYSEVRSYNFIMRCGAKALYGNRLFCDAHITYIHHQLANRRHQVGQPSGALFGLLLLSFLLLETAHHQQFIGITHIPWSSS